MNFIQNSLSFEKRPGALALIDFERAMRLALATPQGDVSALAQLAVCRGALVRTKSSGRRVVSEKRIGPRQKKAEWIENQSSGA